MGVLEFIESVALLAALIACLYTLYLLVTSWLGTYEMHDDSMVDMREADNERLVQALVSLSKEMASRGLDVRHVVDLTLNGFLTNDKTRQGIERFHLQRIMGKDGNWRGDQ